MRTICRCFHFCFQSTITQRRPAASIGESSSCKCLFSLMVDDAGCKSSGLKIRVSVVRFPLATIRISRLIKNDTNVVAQYNTRLRDEARFRCHCRGRQARTCDRA